jgi:hypothetical protein
MGRRGKTIFFTDAGDGGLGKKKIGPIPRFQFLHSARCSGISANRQLMNMFQQTNKLYHQHPTTAVRSAGTVGSNSTIRRAMFGNLAGTSFRA